jgi:hypothetical protein
MRLSYCSVALFLLAMGSVIAQAQPQNSQPGGAPAGNSQPGDKSPQASADQPAAVPGSSGNIQELGNPPKVMPSERPLAGAQVLSLGAAPTGHTLWSPYLSASGIFDSNPLVDQNGGWTAWSMVAGGIDIRRVSRTSDTIFRYDGTGWFSNIGGNNTGGTTFGTWNMSNSQQLGIAETFDWGRLTVGLMDQGAFFPQAFFGFNTGSALVDSASIGLQPGLESSQSILTARGQRLSNTSVLQIGVHLTPRSSLVAVGSYGILHFFENSLVNDNDILLQGGYNYDLSRKDTIAVLYQFGGYRFPRAGQSFDFHSVQFSFARRVTDRFTFQIAAGPDLTFSRRPIIANSGSTIGSLGTGNGRQLFWSLQSLLNYRFRLLSLDLNYLHGVNNGSGVLLGSIVDTASGGVTRQMSRSLQIGLVGGYSRNRGFAALATDNLQTYDYGYAGLNFYRRLGKALNFNFGYQAQYQTSNTAFSFTGTTFLRHEVQAGLVWLPRGAVEYGLMPASSVGGPTLGAPTF